MRRFTQNLLFSTLALSLAVNAPAQRGGPAVGHVTTPTTRAVSPAGGRSLALPHNLPTAPGLWTPAAGYTGINRGALRSTNYRRIPFSYWVAPYYYPPLDYSDSSYAAPPYSGGYDPSTDAVAMAQNALADQVQRLSAQVAQLQYGQQNPAIAYGQQDSQPPQVPVTLVLRNGQQFQVQNYAVMDQTFWDFTRQTARKIPVSSIDVAASAKATQANGGEFPQLDGTR